MITKATPLQTGESRDELAPLIQYLNLFQAIPPADSDIIKEALEFRKVRAREELLREGNICREMYFIAKGVLRIVKRNEKGDDITYFFLKENQFCSILDCFNKGTPAFESIQAACDAEVIVLEKNKYMALFKRLPYLEPLIGNILRQALLEKIAVRSNYLGEDASTRYRIFLLRQPEIALRVPLSDIASYLCITQQSLSRIRKNLRS